MRLSRSRYTAFFTASFLSLATLPTGGHAAGSAPSRVVSATPMGAVRATVIGYYRPGYSYFTCSTQLPAHKIAAWSTCPFTARFLQRLRQSGHANRGVELCPQQYPPQTVKLHALARAGTSTRIDARWDLGARLSYTSTFVAVRRNGSWLVDNEYLAGKPSMDIYHEGSASLCR